MIKIQRNGMVKIKDAKSTGLPIYDFRLTDNPGLHIDLCEDKDFKILKIELTDYEKYQCIRGFVIFPNWRGCKPLYSLKEVLENRRS